MSVAPLRLFVTPTRIALISLEPSTRHVSSTPQYRILELDRSVRVQESLSECAYEREGLFSEEEVSALLSVLLNNTSGALKVRKKSDAAEKIDESRNISSEVGVAAAEIQVVEEEGAALLFKLQSSGIFHPILVVVMLHLHLQWAQL